MILNKFCDQMNFMHSFGELKYSQAPNGNKKLIVLVDQEIVSLMFALTPLYYRLQRQKYPAHISVVRNEWVESSKWGVYEGHCVLFMYDNFTQNDNTYHWARVWSERLLSIRTELGLPRHCLGVTAPPDGEQCFHITIGNTKTK